MSKLPPTPWSVHTEPSPKKFDPATGEPVTPINNYWIRDKDERAIKLFSGKADSEDEEMAYLFVSAPEMLAALQIMLHEFNSKECNCDGECIDGRMRGHACYFHRIEDQLREAIAKATRGGG